MLASIPYTTFPTIELGPLHLRTFGLMVALGVLLGAWVAASHAERFGVSRDETYRVATWMVLAGIIGSRLTWAITHTDQIHNPVDVIAIWEGGIQFSGGFVCAVLVGLPFFRRWDRVQRWRVLDGYGLGLALGLALGRVGCYAVGEHFGRETDFFLASRYDGGEVREPTLGDTPLVPGTTTFHNTSLYEFLYLMVLFAALVAVVVVARRRGREPAPGTLVGAFVLYYGVTRFLSDSLRVNDERVAGMTGAQWMCLVMIPAGIWILWKVRPRMAALAGAGVAAGTVAGAAGDGAAAAGDDAADGAADGAAADEGDAGTAEADAATAEGEPATGEGDAATSEGEPATGDTGAAEDGTAAGDEAAADEVVVDVAPATAARPDAKETGAEPGEEARVPSGAGAEATDAEATDAEAAGEAATDGADEGATVRPAER